MSDQDDFDRDDDFTSGTCPACRRTIYTESACEMRCRHCGWTSEEREEVDEDALDSVEGMRPCLMTI